MTHLHQTLLQNLSSRDCLRALKPQTGLDFSSNDYLGLAQHDGIRQSLIAALAAGIPLGSGGSRLLRGNHPAHEELEAFAASFFGAEACLYMATGFMGNLSLLSALPQRGDHILLDGLIHASSKEGARSSLATSSKFTHNDPSACEEALIRARKKGAKQVWIAVETVYSMDGDRAPLSALLEIADRHEAMIIADEAHATGVHGPDGKGLAAEFEGRDNLIVLHTCGKALGQGGALVTCTRTLRDYLVNAARSFVYTTAPPPLNALAVQEALIRVRDEPWRRERLLQQIAASHSLFRTSLPAEGPEAGTQIIPLILGEERKASQIASSLQKQGFDIRSIRTPTVPKGSARLRLSVTLNVSAADLEALAAAFFQALEDYR